MEKPRKLREAKVLEARKLGKLKKEGGENKEVEGSQGKLREAKALEGRKLGKFKEHGGKTKEVEGS